MQLIISNNSPKVSREQSNRNCSVKSIGDDAVEEDHEHHSTSDGVGYEVDENAAHTT